MDWEPRISVMKQVLDENGVMDLSAIKEPPCRLCSNWKPHLVFRNGQLDGITCCIASEMFSNFSCFTPMRSITQDDPAALPRTTTAPSSPSTPALAPTAESSVQAEMFTHASQLSEPPRCVEKAGYETFKWCGQTRYRCVRTWPESGTECGYDTYDLSLMHEHEKTVHAQKKSMVPAMPTLFDGEGNRVQKTVGAEGELEYRFAPEK